ncbi:MAG: sensor domain-containing diguanylate cyclase [Marinomonas sp.]|jgi:diguanylate cyclase (GGDEF)-like protein/PAS domain S-box-containing protein
MNKQRRDLIDPNYGMVIHRDFVPLYADDNYAKFFGFNEGQDILKLPSIFPLVNEGQREVSLENYRALMNGEVKPQVRSFRHLDQNNIEFFILAIEHIVDWQGEPALQITFIDISAITQAEAKIRESEQKFRDLIEGSIQGMVIHKDFKPLMVNQAYANMHGYDSPQEIMALTDISIFFSEKNIETPLIRASQILSNQTPDPKLRFKNRRKDGSVLWVELVERKVTWNDEDAIQTTLVDVSEQVRMEQKLTMMAMTDSLTGLFNRRFLMDKAAEFFATERNLTSTIACVLIDLDRFKQINDNFGHSAGDEVLKAFSTRCQSLIKEPNYFGRYGGEEFLIMMPGSKIQAAMQLAEEIRLICASEALDTKLGQFSITISAGISCLLPTDTNVDQLIDRADKELYQAKKSGRNRVVGLTK